jgi:hypothetical protein
VTVRQALLAFALVFLVSAKYVLGSVLPINLHRHGASGASSGTLTAQNVVDPDRTLTFSLPASSIALAPGDWFLSAHLDGDWSEPRLVSVTGDAQAIDLDTFPLAKLTARVALKSGKVPRAMKVYFQRVSAGDLAAPAEGNVTCEIAKGVASCGLPAGDFDLVFRIPGYVSRYRWNTSLKPQTQFDAGTLLFVTGSTLSGRVEGPQGRDVRLDRVDVVVRPAAIPGANDEQRHRNDAARIVVHPTRRGSFAFDLPAGQFTIQASYNDLISDEVSADVTQAHEALLRHPLQLEPQRSVSVRVHPPLDPWSKPWTIALAKEDETGHLQSERSLRTEPDGGCRFDHVLPGPHSVTVVRSSNQTWASQTFDVDRDITLNIDVKAVRVTGTLHLGSKPLEAMAMVRSAATGASGFFRSKPDGTFLAALPLPEHDTFDEIEVRATMPVLKRTLSDVHLQRRDGTAELTLALPARSISGMVVDELNRPTPNAMVDVLSPDGSLQQVESLDGSFAVIGLEAGRYQVRAATENRESIDLQTIALGGLDDAAVDVVIPVAPLRHLRGVVRAADGPVMGAALFATRPGDRRPIILSRVDPNGYFDIRFPAATTDVVVAINAPGFAFRLARTPLQDTDETFAVDQNGGTLSIDIAVAKTGSRPYLMHNGAALPAIVVARVAEVPLLANPLDRVRFQIASAEPGTYSLCWLTEGTSVPTGAPCLSGVLAPHGTLTLADDTPR